MYINNKILFSLYFFLCIISCDGQKKVKKCDTDGAINTINSLQEVQKQSKYVDSISLNKKHLSFMTDSLEIENKQYYRVKTGYNGQFHWETYTIFYIEKNNCNNILVDEVVSGEIISLDKWRILNKKVKKMNNTNNSIHEIGFNELFSDGSNITFTPKDLEKKESNIQSFKSKLQSFESSNPKPSDFEIGDLLLLINNETFSNNERFVNSSWLEYFVNKYNFNKTILDSLMNTAIMQEDLSAIKILSKNYIFSKKQLDEAMDKKEYKNSLKGKIDIDQYYDPSFSKIDEIVPLINNSFLRNHIQDPDGYTNLRKDKNTSSEVLQKIKSGEYIEVLDNSRDWFLVKTKEGIQGFVYSNRVNN